MKRLHLTTALCGSLCLLPATSREQQCTAGSVAAASTTQSGSFLAKNYGALGDGSGSTIGVLYGTTPAQLASYQSSSGGYPFAWATNPLYGLTFTLVTSAAQSAKGTTLTFLRTATGINNWSIPLALFNGDPVNESYIVRNGMLVTGSASCLPSGASVSSFSTSAGTITLSAATSAACASGTSVTFTITPAMVEAMTYDELGIQSAIYAASKTASGATVEIGYGQFVSELNIWDPPITNTNARTPALYIKGQDEYGTSIAFTTDSGPATIAFGETFRGPGSQGYTRYSDFRLIGPGSANQAANTVAGMSGLGIGSKDRVDHIVAGQFGAGISVLEDHASIKDAILDNNGSGVLMDANGDTIGNLDIEDTTMSGEAVAGIDIAWNNSLAAATLIDDDIGGYAPYEIHRQALPSASNGVLMGAVVDSTFLDVYGEQVKLGMFYGENYQAGNSSDSFIGNTIISQNPVISFQGGMPSAGWPYAGSTRKPVSVITAGSVTGNTFINADLTNGGQNFANITDGIIEGYTVVANNKFGDLTPYFSGYSGTLPYIYSVFNGNEDPRQYAENSFETNAGGYGEFMATEASTLAGQIMQPGTAFSYFGTRPMTSPISMPTGVAMEPALQYAFVPELLRGSVRSTRKLPGVAISVGAPVCPSSSDPTAVTVCLGNASIVGYDDDGNNSGSASTAVAIRLQPALHSSPNVSTQSANYTLTQNDCGSIIRDTGTSAHTYTVPTGLQLGCKVEVIQAAAGALTAAAGSGETIETLSGNNVTGGVGDDIKIDVDSASSFAVLP